MEEGEKKRELSTYFSSADEGRSADFFQCSTTEDIARKRTTSVRSYLIRFVRLDPLSEFPSIHPKFRVSSKFPQKSAASSKNPPKYRDFSFNFSIIWPVYSIAYIKEQSSVKWSAYIRGPLKLLPLYWKRLSGIEPAC